MSVTTTPILQGGLNMGKGIIYSNPSGLKELESAYKKIKKDPTYKPPKGGTFNVNTLKPISKGNKKKTQKLPNNYNDSHHV